MCIRAHLYLRTITNCLITRGYRTVQYHYWAPNSFTLLCRFLHNMLTNTGHCINGQCMGMVHGLLPCMPPPAPGGRGGRWHMVLRRVQRQMRVPHFFPCLTTHARPPRGPEGWMAHGATESTEASASASLPAPPPPGPDPSRLTPLPPPVSRLPPVVPSRPAVPPRGPPPPPSLFFVLLSCPLHGGETRPMENAEAHDAHDTILHWHPL